MRKHRLSLSSVLSIAAFFAIGGSALGQSKSSRDPATLDFEAHLGLGVRLGDSQYFRVEDPAAPVLGAGVWLSPNAWAAVGLEYDHTFLGRETSGPGDLGAAELTRTLNTIWLGGRFNLLHGARGELWVGVGPGLVFQSEEASLVSLGTFGQQSSTFACTGSDSARIALRAGAGGAIHLGSGLYLSPETIIEGDQLSSDPLGSCTPGPGSIGILTLRLGFFYRADVTRRVR